jgi:electron transfer flavoprotein alpha subunit
MTVLCLVEHDASGVADASLRALSFASALAKGSAPRAADGGGPVDGGGLAEGGAAPASGRTATDVAAVVFATADAVPGGTLASYGAAAAYAVDPGDVPGYAPQAWARSLAGLAAQTGAGAVLAAATDRGNEVMAHLGAITGQPMAANCVSAQPGDGGTYRITRQRWAGLLLEDALLEGAPALMTVAPEAVAATAVAEPATLTVHPYEPDLAGDDLRVRATESAGQSSGVSLATARVVVGGGRGVGGPDGFAPLEELAGLLGGVVGVSRVVTSEGWRPHRQQVGQTGTKITPELYLACGISGAIQHMAGCAGAKHIVAVNTDPGAPILAHADYAVLGDLREVIPALVAALRARSGSS